MNFIMLNAECSTIADPVFSDSSDSDYLSGKLYFSLTYISIYLKQFHGIMRLL